MIKVLGPTYTIVFRTVSDWLLPFNRIKESMIELEHHDRLTF